MSTLKVRVYIFEPDEPDWFVGIVRNYLTAMETSRLRSEGFVEGSLDSDQLEGLLHCPAVRSVETIKQDSGWRSWFRR